MLYSVSSFRLFPQTRFRVCIIGRVDAEAEAPILWPSKQLTHWKRPCCWERLRAGGEGDNRGWDGWITSPTQCTWVWVHSGRWWRTGKLGMLQSLGCERVRHHWGTEQQNVAHLKLIVHQLCRNKNFNKIIIIQMSFKLAHYLSLIKVILCAS